jgi:pantoate--beta-alanine ligase
MMSDPTGAQPWAADRVDAPPSTVVRTRNELAAALQNLRISGRTIALVPTMGALHDGHRSLLRNAADIADDVVVSIFVNPLQFGPAEDFGHYPRSFGADLAICAEHKVGIVFAPDVQTVYPGGDPLVRIDPGPVGTQFEGRARPGHFSGVLTVVAKLLGLIRPDIAVFGEKDAQQLFLIREMVADLDLGIEIASVPVFRDPDGLAVSSRNRYLDAEARAAALALSRSLHAARIARKDGPKAARSAALAVLEAETRLSVDYCAVVDPRTFSELAGDDSDDGLMIVAAKVAGTRLIDTAGLDFSPPGAPAESAQGSA